MINLIYFSAASYLYSNDELATLLTEFRLKNVSLNITGLLLYHDGSIIQILEGEAEDVHALFNSIKIDLRHTSVTKVIDCNIEERSFSNWSMGFKNISKQDFSKLNGYLNIENKNEFTEIKISNNTQIIRMVNSFASVNMLNDFQF